MRPLRRLTLPVALLALAAPLAPHSAVRVSPDDGARARAALVIRAEFGARLTPCVLSIARRETGGTFDPRAANWTDRHSDGSRGSFGLLQIGALHRRATETVVTFARRMFIAQENVRLGHVLYRRAGLRPWGGYC